MNIKEALDPTGKAICEEYPRYYARWEGTNLQLFLKEKDVYIGLLAHDKILSDDWQPYHEEKEIVPQASGEVWSHGGIKYFTVKGVEDRLRLRPERDSLCSLIMDNVIHGKHGCKRLYPPVEDDSVERIEIEYAGWNCISPLNITMRPRVDSLDTLRDKIRGKDLILEIPKDKP